MTKRGNEVQVGDIILFAGRPHRVAKIEPYTHPTLGETCGIARASDGWGITLFPSSQVEVV